MGATLALTLAQSHTCAGVISINAAFSVPCYEVYDATNSPKYIDESAPDMKDSSVYEIVYDTVPVSSILQLLRLIPFAKARLSSVHCPVLLLHSEEDHVVPAHSAYQVYDAIGSSQKKFIPLTNSYHVASMDFDKDKIVNYCTQFIEGKLSLPTSYKASTV
jgi:carboxylesterase